MTHVRLEHAPPPREGEPPRVHVSGTAVRFHDLLDERSYEVLGHLEVRDAPGRESSALRSLRLGARALGADLLLDVTFRRDEADGEVRVSGTAVRFHD